MVNLINLYKILLRWVMKTAGMKPRRLEIEEGTFINFWISTNNNHKQAAHGVVLLHGFAADGILTWQFQALAFAKKYALYIPDFVFFGDSITNKTERSPEFQAECVAKGLKMLGVDKCTLVGFSYGGMVGFKMGEMYPELVHSMVVSGGVIGLVESISGRSLERIGGFSSWSRYLIPHTVEGVRMLLAVACYQLPSIPNFLLKHYLEVMFENRKEKVELLEALEKKDEDFVIPSYSQKIHLLWGEKDLIFDMQDAYNVKKQLKEKAELQCIEKAGHLVHIERPFLYNACLNQILHSLLF